VEEAGLSGTYSLTGEYHSVKIPLINMEVYFMKAVIDADACIGCGLCAQIAPEVYEMLGDKAVVIGDNVSEDKVESVQSGADQCPVNAITIL